MKKVLLITNAFPPMLGGGVIRPSRLAKYLPEWGWTPIVLSMAVSSEAARMGDPASKYAQHIIRLPRLDPTTAYAWMKNALSVVRPRKNIKVQNLGAKSSALSAGNTDRPRLSNAFLVPDPRVFWIPLATIVGWITSQRSKPAAIFSMSPDPSAHLVALLLKKLTGRRWVAEFRDPWMSNPFRHPRPFRWMERLESWLEQKVVLGCDHICVTSAEYRDDFLRRYPALSSGKINFIPNGFDPTDFEGLVPEKFERFTIMHAGNFYGARSAELFLTAYAGMLARRPDLRERTQAVFVGSIDKAAMDKLGSLFMEQNVVLMGNRSHRESLRLTCGADILLLIPGPGNGTMPGKTYEYLRAGRPVYCLGAAGPAADLIRRTGAGVVEAATDSTIISISLEHLVDRVAHDPMIFTCVPAVLNQYNRREIAGKIAAVLEGQS